MHFASQETDIMWEGNEEDVRNRELRKLSRSDLVQSEH